MLPAARRDRAALAAGVGQPQARLGRELADVSERHGQRLLGQHFARLLRRHGQDQLEILAVREGVLQRRRAVGKPLGQSPGVVGHGQR